MLDIIPYTKFPFTDLQGKLPCPQKPSINSSHESNTSKPKLPFHFINKDFCIIFKSVWGSIISKMTRLYVGRSEVQILAGAIELSLLQNIQTSSSTHPASNSSSFSGSKMASADSLTTHLSRAKFKNQWNYIYTQPVSLYGTYWDNFIVPLPPTYVCISQEVTFFLVL